MSASDIARGRVELTPIIRLTADADASSVNRIHHDVKGRLGGKLELTAVANDEWYYSESTDVNETTSILIPDGASYTNGSATVDAGSGKDKVKYLYVENLDNDFSVYLVLDGSSTPKDQGDALVIEPKNSIILTPNRADVGDVKVETIDDVEVKVRVLALLRDEPPGGGG